MSQISIYLNFIRDNGRPLSEINPGSDAFALEVNDALYAVDLLRNARIAILGGDILTEDKENNKLGYVVHLWGHDYHYLNWYCNKEDNESQENYIERSYIIAKESIKVANGTAKRFEKKCYIVIVI